MATEHIAQESIHHTLKLRSKDLFILATITNRFDEIIHRHYNELYKHKQKKAIFDSNCMNKCYEVLEKLLYVLNTTTNVTLKQFMFAMKCYSKYETEISQMHNEGHEAVQRIKQEFDIDIAIRKLHNKIYNTTYQDFKWILKCKKM